MLLGAGLGERSAGLGDLLGNLERRVVPAGDALGLSQDLFAQWRAVCLGRALDAGGAVADHGAYGDEARPGVGLGPGDGRVDRVDVGSIRDQLGVPAVRGKAGDLVVAAGPVDAAVDGDGVVVPKRDESAEPVVAGQGGGLVAHALHQAAVADDDVGVVIGDLGVAGVLQ